jgi:2-polyprenyl-3-methyl-5-hydroxy-6-metoxy-1,4-benzoquinol methylase
MKKICPICISVNINKIRELYDDRYGYPGIFELYKCTSCNHKFLDHRFTPRELGNLYSNYYPRSNIKIEDYSPLKYAKGFKTWFNGEKRSAYIYVPKKVRVLDIGCGFGQSLGYHQNRGCEVFGVEADENIQRVADKFGFNVKVGLFDANDYEKDFFDYVTMDQVIEHVTDPQEVLSGTFSILKPNGYAILSTPNSNGWGAWLFGKRWINWHTPYHLQHFSKKSLANIAQKTGFKIEKIKTVTSSEWLHYQWMHVMTFPKEGEKSIFWDSGITKSTTSQKIILKLITLLHKTKINHILTRFFDAIGLGDNYIIILKKEV